MPAETVELRIGNLAKAVLVTGQAYQDPKDALNEFVSNAADEYVEAGARGRIRVILRRKGGSPVIAIDDEGRGMSPDRLRDIACNLFESPKVGDPRTVGEKAIGMLAFQQLGGRCELVSRADGSDETYVLRLERGTTTASIERERRRARQIAGTTVFLSELDPYVLRVLTQHKVVEYLRARRAPALERGDYTIEVVEGRSAEVVLPVRPDGARLAVTPRNTLWGRIEFILYAAPRDVKRRRVAVVGRGGTTIIDDISELEEFGREPWTSDQVSGQIVFEALQQAAGRRAILRDREAFPVLVDAVQAVEPSVARTIARITREVDELTADRVCDAARRLFGRVLRDIAYVDAGVQPPVASPFGPSFADPDAPCLEELILPPLDGEQPARRAAHHLPSVAPDPSAGDARSRFDAEANVVLFNDRHADYLLVKDSESALLDYLATLVAKEYVVANNASATPEELTEEMVRMVVRVRRHLPRRNW